MSSLKNRTSHLTNPVRLEKHVVVPPELSSKTLDIPYPPTCSQKYQILLWFGIVSSEATKTMIKCCCYTLFPRDELLGPPPINSEGRGIGNNECPELVWYAASYLTLLQKTVKNEVSGKMCIIPGHICKYSFYYSVWLSFFMLYFSRLRKQNYLPTTSL